MKKKLFDFLRFIKRILMRFKNLFRVHKIVLQDTYYPEYERKNTFTRFLDNIVWVLKFAELNIFYNLYGFDVKTKKNTSEYIDYLSFMRNRNRMNNMDETYNYVCLLRDKYLFSKYLKSNGISVVNNIAIIVDGKIYDDSFKIIESINNLFDKDVFIKRIDGECANGVFHIKNYQEYKEKAELFSKGRFIIQEKLIQHDDLAKINSNSVNTIRIVTVKKQNNIEVLCSGLRVGTSKSGSVDNWAAGGLYIDINDDGTLTKYGFAKPKMRWW